MAGEVAGDVSPEVTQYLLADAVPDSAPSDFALAYKHVRTDTGGDLGEEVDDEGQFLVARSYTQEELAHLEGIGLAVKGAGAVYGVLNVHS